MSLVSGIDVEQVLILSLSARLVLTNQLSNQISYYFPMLIVRVRVFFPRTARSQGFSIRDYNNEIFKRTFKSELTLFPNVYFQCILVEQPLKAHWPV